MFLEQEEDRDAPAGAGMGGFLAQAKSIIANLTGRNTAILRAVRSNGRGR